MKKDKVWDKDKYVIYIHDMRRLGADHIYVGQAKGNPWHRWFNNNMKHKYPHGKARKAFDAIPLDFWKHEILKEGFSAEEADIWETIYILEFDSVENGLNSNCGRGLKKVGLTKADVLENKEECLRKLYEKAEKLKR